MKPFLKVNKNDTLTALTMYSIAAVVLVYLLLDLKIVIHKNEILIEQTQRNASKEFEKIGNSLTRKFPHPFLDLWWPSVVTATKK